MHEECLCANMRAVWVTRAKKCSVPHIHARFSRGFSIFNLIWAEMHANFHSNHCLFTSVDWTSLHTKSVTYSLEPLSIRFSLYSMTLKFEKFKDRRTLLQAIRNKLKIWYDRRRCEYLIDSVLETLQRYFVYFMPFTIAGILGHSVQWSANRTENNTIKTSLFELLVDNSKAAK